MKTEIIHFSVVPFLATTVKIYAYLLSMMLKSTLNLTRSNFTFCLNMNQICKLGWNHWYYFNGEEMTMAENDNGRGKVSYVNLRIIPKLRIRTQKALIWQNLTALNPPPPDR